MENTKPLVRTEWAETDPLLTLYYDTEWGMPVYDETGVFERISLETFQGGLSWLIILRRRDALREAFAGFKVDVLKNFGEAEISELLKNEKIIRNEKKIRSIIDNAKLVAKLRETEGENWLSDYVWSFMPETSPAVEKSSEIPAKSKESEALSAGLKSKGFKFFGPVMAYSTMSALGVVDAHTLKSHRRGCSGLWNKDGSRSYENSEISDVAV